MSKSIKIQITKNNLLCFSKNEIVIAANEYMIQELILNRNLIEVLNRITNSDLIILKYGRHVQDDEDVAIRYNSVADDKTLILVSGDIQLGHTYWIYIHPEFINQNNTMNLKLI